MDVADTVEEVLRDEAAYYDNDDASDECMQFTFYVVLC